MSISPKRIHIAPVGFEIDRIVIPAKQDKAEKVYLLVHSNKSEDKGLQYINEVQKQLKKAKIATELVSCDWRNIEEITRVTRDLILKESANHISINLSSGSKNHAIALDRACMTFRKRYNLRPFYAEAENYAVFKVPAQAATGVKQIKVIPTHRIIVPEPELIATLKIIKEKGVKIPTHPDLKGIKQKELALECEQRKIIQFNARRNQSQVRLTTLDRSILQKLRKTWKAIKITEVGRNRWVWLTDEGRYLLYTLYNEETY